MIELEQIRFGYDQTPVLDQLSMQIKDGTFCAVIGPSGSGKSTLLRLISGLRTPQAGRIRINGRLLYDEQQKRTRTQRLDALQAVGYIFQDFQLFPHLTVMRNLTLAPDLQKHADKQRNRAKAEKLLTQLGLTEVANRYPGQLSGGQKQRVAIARSLMMNPGILLVDEATSALDPQRKQEFMEQLCTLRDQGMTILMISHEQDLMYAYADEVIDLNKLMKR